MTTTTPNRSPNVALPVGTVEADRWEDIDAQPWRTVTFLRHQVTDSDARASMNACQHADGRIDEYEVVVIGDHLNSDQARELAAVLLEAAAEIDRQVTR
uniref:hypothetical protein n=1 Tax=Mycobacterium sp. HUMS_1102779 TaxID=3383487 RepID=UPI00389AD446